MSTFIDLLISTLTQGLIYAQLSYGVFITYKILDFPDLTVDGSFPLGAAVTAVLLVSGCNPYLALLAAAGVGALAGLATGVWSGMEELKSIWRSDLTLQPQMDDAARARALLGWHRAVERSQKWIQGDGEPQ